MYNFKTIENKANKVWNKVKDQFKSGAFSDKKSFYMMGDPLSPSIGGLNVNDVSIYIIMDMISKFKRMEKMNVMFPISLDSLDMNKKLDIKKKLFEHCENYVNQKIIAAEEAISNAQRSANKETKNSSGDKYETGRSMMQLEIEKYSAQLNDGLTLKKVLNQIDTDKLYNSAQTGSLVETNQGNFFISISAGKINVDNKEYFSISYSSPIGQVIFNKLIGDKFIFRQKEYIIQSIT
jgi:valyl-tRNA synthetase